MLKLIALGLAVLICGCNTIEQNDGEGKALIETIEISELSDPPRYPRGLITERLAKKVLSEIDERDSPVFLRPKATAILTRNGFAVSDGHALHIFDSTSHLIASHGREGAGPGEYKNLRSICYTIGDTLVVFDTGLNRVSILTSDGKFVRGFSVGGGSVHARNACLSDGTFLVQRYRARHQFTVYRYGIDGVVRDSSLALNFDLSLGGLQLMVEPTVAAFQGSVLFGDPWNGSVELYDTHGNLHHSLKLMGPKPERIPDDMPMYARPMSGEVMNVPAKIRTFPYFQRIRVAQGGVFWYNDFPRTRNAAIRWYGVARNGKRVGVVQMDSDAVVNHGVSVEDFGVSSMLLRIEHETRGAVFRIVSIATPP